MPSSAGPDEPPAPPSAGVGPSGNSSAGRKAARLLAARRTSWNASPEKCVLGAAHNFQRQLTGADSCSSSGSRIPIGISSGAVGLHNQVSDILMCASRRWRSWSATLACNLSINAAMIVSASPAIVLPSMTSGALMITPASVAPPAGRAFRLPGRYVGRPAAVVALGRQDLVGPAGAEGHALPRPGADVVAEGDVA